MSSLKAVRASVLEEELINNIAAGTPVMIWGPPGVGKSDIVKQVATKLNRKHMDLRANLLDPTDLRGFPYIKNERACWAPPTFLPDPAREGEADAILNLEEVPAAPPSTQTALYQLVLDYRIGEYYLPPNVAIIATGNQQGDRAATFSMPTPLKNRFAHYLLEVNLDDWLTWAFVNDVDHTITAFMRFKPSNLHAFDPSVEAFPTPRSWAKLAKRLKHTNEGNLFTAASSLVGQGAGGEYVAFCKVYEFLPDLDQIEKDPKGTRLPKNDPATLYAICGALSHRATRENVGAILQYVGRMEPEFQVLFVKDAVKRTKKLMATPEFNAWAQKNTHIIL